jgi:hypothetical protein
VAFHDVGAESHTNKSSAQSFPLFPDESYVHHLIHYLDGHLSVTNCLHAHPGIVVAPNLGLGFEIPLNLNTLSFH